MGIEIRNAAPEEYQAAIDVISTAFLERPDLRAVAESVAEIWESGPDLGRVRRRPRVRHVPLVARRG